MLFPKNHSSTSDVSVQVNVTNAHRATQATCIMKTASVNTPAVKHRDTDTNTEAVKQVEPWHKQKAKLSHAIRLLSPINEFLLVLCRLRLHLLEEDIAFRFDISQTTVSSIIFSTWIYFFILQI